MIKIIRYLTLITGSVIMIYIMSVSFNEGNLILSMILILLIWIMFPFYLFFFLTGKSEKTLKVLLPALVLIFIYIVFTEEYFRSDKATAGLVLLAMPVCGLAALGSGYLIYHFFSLFKKT